MLRVLLAAGLCLSFVSASTSEELFCYFNRRAVTRAADEAFRPSHIDPDLCTHIIFSSADINNYKLVPVAAGDTALYAELNNLKTRNPQLKILLAVGGPDFDNQKFSSMVAFICRRRKFINSAIALLQNHGFNGLSLDWQFPGKAQQKRKFTKLCQELKAEFAKRTLDLILSASVSAEKTTIDVSYNVAALAAALDFIFVMTFNFHATTTAATAHHSPLSALSTNAADTLTTEFAMNYWRSLGAPANKLLVGLAAFGRTFQTTTSAHGVGAPANGPACNSIYPGEAGILAYYEICSFLKEGSVHWIDEQKVPYAFDGNEWVGFDNKQSLKLKVEYLKKNNFAGAFIWALDMDDFSGEFCEQGNYPLVNTVRSALAADYTTTTADYTTTTASPTGTGSANFCVGKKDGEYPNVNNVHTFYKCSNGNPYLYDCPAGLVYNAASTRCDWP